jgi:hypothetical protein
LIFEAQQAHYYGLPWNLALASVTSTPATALGLGHRIGFIRPGYDADLVLWDAHPLSLSATPKQVIVDGIQQLAHAHNAKSKPIELQKAPPTPNWDEEAAAAVKYEGLPPLTPKKSLTGTVMFTNVSTLWTRQAGGGAFASTTEVPGAVVVSEGEIVCVGSCQSFASRAEEQVDLAGGSLAPALISYGSAVGLQEIPSESTTQDGLAPDALLGRPGSLIGGEGVLSHAVDGLQFGGRDALCVYYSSLVPAQADIFTVSGTSMALGPRSLRQSTAAS